MNANITPRRPASDPRFEVMLESQEFLVNPYPVLRELRTSAPIYWSDAIGGWLLTRHSDILASFKDPAHFSNEDRLAKTADAVTMPQWFMQHGYTAMSIGKVLGG